MRQLTIGSLFSGYGGLDMAAEHVFGARTAWVSDIDKGARKVLAHRYPHAPNLGDITAIDWADVEPVDIITGGSPCQDLSTAGRRAGMTEGTRSNLWVAMREAIANVQPAYVIWENVRGAFSACASSDADRDLGFCPRCLDPRDRTARHDPNLRALGRVLGDLSELGFDAEWRGLRASDVGACHQRFRVFVLAWRRDAADSNLAGLQGQRHPQGAAQAERHGHTEQGTGGSALTLLPSPRTSDTNGAGHHGDGGLDLRTAVTLLPTPAASVANDGEGTETWLARRERVKLTAANGNGMGMPLTIAVQMLPTPRATDGIKGGPNQRGSSGDLMLPSAVIQLTKEEQRDENTGPSEVLPSVWRANGEEAIQWPTGGPGALPEQEDLLTALREQQGGGSGGLAPMESAADHEGGALHGLRRDGEPARSPQGPRRDEQHPGEPGGTVRQLSPQTALAGGSHRTHGVHFGPYETAVQRWESVLGREAPAPTEPGRNGKPRLSAEFVSWMMGCPEGWIVDVPGVTRNEALKLGGNGVVRQQARAALEDMLAASMGAAA